jgi:hypothetical protein
MSRECSDAFKFDRITRSFRHIMKPAQPQKIIQAVVLFDIPVLFDAVAAVVAFVLLLLLFTKGTVSKAFC